MRDKIIKFFQYTINLVYVLSLYAFIETKGFLGFFIWIGIGLLIFIPVAIFNKGLWGGLVETAKDKSGYNERMAKRKKESSRVSGGDGGYYDDSR